VRPTAERRLVTVLFADLVGFTPFAEEQDPEIVREILSRYFEIASEVIGRHGGVVEKFIGDAVMAVWGAPITHEDDAERAVRAALQLVDAIRSLGPAIQARAGLTTGEAAATSGATNQGMVAGDLVNTAARLQSVATPGTVLVAEATQRAAGSAIAFEPAGDQLLKGKASPVPAFTAIRVLSERGGRGRSDALEAPFVGREDELQQIKDLFHATARDRRVRLVAVSGVAGVGKGRLAWEFEKYLDGIVESVLWHRGRSPAYGGGVTFWALGEMVRERAGLAESDDEATTRARIAAVLDGLPLSGDERPWVESALLALLGFGTGMDPEQLFGAWRTFFERLALTGPVVLVFEDLQWADTATLDFIDQVLERSRGVPLFILVLARPELLEARPDLITGPRNVTSIVLEPLTADAMRRVLAGLVPGLPVAAIGAIVERADGIPLYAVETVRMLQADGSLTLNEEGTSTPAGPIDALRIPESLTALIAARLDALDPTDRALVLDAAVLGQAFAPAALAAVSGQPEAALAQRLRSLVRRDVFDEQTDARSPERGQYVFVQALVREVAYNTLARSDRKARHLAAARYFESLDSDQIAAALADHYLAAYHSVTDATERNTLAAQARVALRAAGDRAAALGAHRQAVTFYRQALSVTTAPDVRAPLLERAGSAAANAARYEEADALLAEAVEAARAAGDAELSARITTNRARTMLTARRNVEAMAILEAAVVDFAAVDPTVLAGLQSQLARSYMLAEDHARAIVAIEPALAAAEDADDLPLLADALVTKGSTLLSARRIREGLAVLDLGMRLARANGLAATELRAINNQLSALYMDPHEGVRLATDGVATAHRIGARGWENELIGKAATAQFLVGEWDDALRLVEELIAEGPEPGELIDPLHVAVKIRGARGDDVQSTLEAIDRVVPSLSDPQVLWAEVDAKAFAALVGGDLAGAARRWRDAARRFHTRPYEWLFWSSLLELRLGNLEAAVDALAAFEALHLHAPIVQARQAVLRGCLEAVTGRPEEGTRHALAGFAAMRNLGLALDQGLAATLFASVLDPAAAGVDEAIRHGRGQLIALRARMLVDQLDEAVARRDRVRPEGIAVG
jgi:class 3 adenylate cyclase/tetratricopeptide (TPR) repeat protein